jgi:hypothetical protein
MTSLALEDRSARLTILIDPRKKALFERLCAEEDSTPSQVVRRMIRQFILERTGKPWTPSADEPPADVPKQPPSHGARRGRRS